MNTVRCVLKHKISLLHAILMQSDSGRRGGRQILIFRQAEWQQISLGCGSESSVALRSPPFILSFSLQKVDFSLQSAVASRAQIAEQIRESYVDTGQERKRERERDERERRKEKKKKKGKKRQETEGEPNEQREALLCTAQQQGATTARMRFSHWRGFSFADSEEGLRRKVSERLGLTPFGLEARADEFREIIIQVLGESRLERLVCFCCLD